MKRSVIITKKGQQIPVQSGDDIKVSVFLSDDEIKEEVELDVTDKEFKEIRKQAVTNKIPAVILKEKKAKQ